MADFKNFDLNLLRALDVLLEEANVSRAARRLNLSQPATSGALARLRGALNDRLLIRRGNRMILSKLAEQLQPEVRRLLGDIEQTLSAAGGFNPAVSKRVFRVAANDYAAFILLPALAGRIRLGAPNVVVEVMPLYDRIDDRLNEGDIDIALRDRWSLRNVPHLETLFVEDYVCLARGSHPRLPQRPDLEDFLAESHVLVTPRGRVTGAVDLALQSIGRSRHVAMTVPHFLVAPALVAGSDLVITTARRVAILCAAQYGLRMFEPPFDVEPFPVAMAWTGRNEADAGLAWFKDQLRAVAKQPWMANSLRPRPQRKKRVTHL